MGEYATKIEENGKTKWKSSDGRVYSTRSGAWKRSKKLEAGADDSAVAGSGDAPVVAEAKEGGRTRPDPAPEPEPEPEPTPAWATFDFEDYEGPNEFVPGVLKQIKPASGGSKKSQKQFEAEKQTSLAILGVGYRSMDVVLTKYKQAILQDRDAEPIRHSEQDIEWISEITNAALLHSDVHLANAFSPVQVAVVCNGYWFGKPIYQIQKEAKRSPFAGAGRIIERLPFIGRRLKARREASEAAANHETEPVIQA